MEYARGIVPVTIVLLLVQYVVSLLWMQPLFRMGLPIYRRTIFLPRELSREATAKEISSRIPWGLVVRRLSDTEIGVRCSAFTGFTGVQGVISLAHPVTLTARIGWPATVAYVLFLFLIWLQFPGSFLSLVPLMLIVVLIPLTDILQMHYAMSKFAAKASDA